MAAPTAWPRPAKSISAEGGRPAWDRRHRRRRRPGVLPGPFPGGLDRSTTVVMQGQRPRGAPGQPGRAPRRPEAAQRPPGGRLAPPSRIPGTHRSKHAAQRHREHPAGLTRLPPGPFPCGPVLDPLRSAGLIPELHSRREPRPSIYRETCISRPLCFERRLGTGAPAARSQPQDGRRQAAPAPTCVHLAPSAAGHSARRRPHAVRPAASSRRRLR